MIKKIRFIKRMALALLFISVTAYGAHAEYKTGYVKSYFIVDHVSVIGAATVDVEVLEGLIGTVEGENIFEIDLPGIGEKIENHPWISSVKVKRQLPSTLKVEVEERKPAALLDAKKTWLIDKAGVCLRAVDPAEGIRLPVLTGFKPDKRKLAPGAMLGSKGVVNAIKVARRLSGYRLFGLHKLSSMDVSRPGGVTIKFDDTQVELIAKDSGWTDEAERLRTVDYILRESTASILSIDLTFNDKVIVTYPTKKEG